MERFYKPTAEQVREYGLSIGYRINSDMFVNFYESKGWMVGKNHMKSWKAAVKTWKIRAGINTTMAETPKESDGDKKVRFFKERRCQYCKGGKLKKMEGFYECSGCPARYAIEKVEA